MSNSHMGTADPAAADESCAAADKQKSIAEVRQSLTLTLGRCPTIYSQDELPPINMPFHIDASSSSDIGKDASSSATLQSGVLCSANSDASDLAVSQVREQSSQVSDSSIQKDREVTRSRSEEAITKAPFRPETRKPAITSPFRGLRAARYESDAINPLEKFYNHADVRTIARDLASFYKVDKCLISLGEKNGKIFTACSYGTDETCKIFPLGASKLCRMLAQRGAPIIIADLHKYAPLHDDPLIVNTTKLDGAPTLDMHFYVELSLRFSSGSYRGTVCLSDVEGRENFTLDDSEQLKAKRNELVEVLERLGFD